MKDASGIYFEKFPGKPYVTPGKKKMGNKKFKIWFAVILAIIVLLLFSSFLNVWLLKEEEDNSYNTVNFFDGYYAVINPADRESLFLNIGFDGSQEETVVMYGDEYATTYAYKSHDENLTDSINVYYDTTNTVFYLSLSLMYTKDSFTKQNLVNDSNLIIQNFFDVQVSLNDLEDLMQNYSSFITYNFIGISYEVTYESNDFYVITITCGITD